MKRRSFLSFALALSFPAMRAHAGPAPLDTAAARLGQRLSDTADAQDLVRLRSMVRAGHRPALTALAKTVSADFRAGRTSKISGVTFSDTEAAWFLAAFDESRERS